MRLKVFNSICKDFSRLFEKYHCQGVIIPLFMLVFGFSCLSKVNIATSVNTQSYDKEVVASSGSIDKAESPAQIDKEISSSYKTTIRNTAISSSDAVQLTSKSTPSVPANSITINGQTGSIFYTTPVNGEFPDTGRKIGLYNGVFLFGHRGSSVFSNLSSLGVGSTFTITLNGNSKQYVVQKAVVLDYDTAQSNRAQYYVGRDENYKKYDYVLMTCAGQSLGGGQATHRLMVFVKEA